MKIALQLAVRFGASIILLQSCISNRALAAGTVTVCDEPSLRAALAGGGLVTIACDGTITLGSELAITNATTMDGSEHTITISGGNTTRLYVVNPGVNLTLQHMTIADGFVTNTTGQPGLGGAILNNGGQINLIDCRVSGNAASGGGASIVFPNGFNAGSAFGGAIYSSNGVVWATNTLFNGNRATGGQAKGVDGIAAQGGNAWGGALYQTGGQMSLWNCRFETNTAFCPPPNAPQQIGGWPSSGESAGGAIVHSNGALTVVGCQFVTNDATGGNGFRFGQAGSGRGGAIFSASSLTLSNSVFLRNRATGGTFGPHGGVGAGGALCLMQPAFVSTCLFEENSARGNQGVANSENDHTVSPGAGGAIFNAGVLRLTDSALVSNHANGPRGTSGGGVNWSVGGPGSGGAVFCSGQFFATNVTFALNDANGGTNVTFFPGAHGGDGRGGGVSSEGGTVVLAYTTVAGNSAVTGAGFIPGTNQGGAFYNSNGTITVIGSIIANGLSGSNAFGPIIDGGHNLSSDASCAFTGIGSLNNTDPVIAPLDDYGGPTPTVALLAGSPAIDGGGNPGSPSTDQRGRARPFGAASDIGAFESSPPYVIGGQISGPTFQGEALVSAESTSVNTVNGGNYKLMVAAGPHIVTPSLEDYVFDPTNRAVTAGPDLLGVDFKAYRMHALSLEGFSGGTLSMLFAGTNGTPYRVQFSTNLTSWVTVATNTPVISNLFQIIDPSPGQPSGFYRVVVP